MAGEPPVIHPCHQLSNPSARMFWCRHCMIGFPDPMQRWRHSKECKAISSQKKYGSHNPPNQHMVPSFQKYESPTPSPQSDTSTPNKKKKSLDLKCYICKREFITINEMRDHVKRPCNKPEAKNPLKDTFDSLISTNEDDSDDSVSQNEEKVTNQIETLLKAAQILQQKKDRLLASSKQIKNGSAMPQRRLSENADVDDPLYDSQTDEAMLDMLNSGQFNDKDELHKFFDKDSELDQNQQAHDNAEKLDIALKVYDFISDTPEPSPCPPETLPCQVETSPCQPELSPCQPEPDSSNDQVSTEALNKTYVSSLQPQTSDSNKIPKITLKLVSGEKPKTEVWGIGTDLPKRIRKRKSKDFFDDLPVKVKKKEMTLKEMQDKLIKNKAKLKIDKKKLLVNVTDGESIINNAELETVEVAGESTINDNNETKKSEIKTKKRDVKNGNRTRTGKIVGKKNLVVVLTDCFSGESSSGSNNTRKPNRGKKLLKKTVNGKQKSELKAKLRDKSKNGKAGSKDKLVNADKAKRKDNAKTCKQSGDKKNDKSKSVLASNSTLKQKLVSKTDLKKVLTQKQKTDKSVKCRACDRTFKTRDLLIKHNQVPCRMRNTRNMTQIILRPKKHACHTLPLTQRQINAAKRRKQVAGKLSILDNSVRKEDIDNMQSGKSDKVKKTRNRKRMTSSLITFCITPKDRSQTFNLDFDLLSEKDQYFYKLGMYSVSLKMKNVEKIHVESNHLVKSVNSQELKPCEISVESGFDSQSLPSFPTTGSEISPPILEKMSEVQGECDEQNENEISVVKIVSSQESLDPPNLIFAHGAPSVLDSDKHQRNEKLFAGLPCPTPPNPSDLMSDLFLSEDFISRTITHSAFSELCKTTIDSSHLVNKDSTKLKDDENNKENRVDNSYLLLKTSEIGVCCTAEDILNEVEKWQNCEAIGVKLIKPRERLHDDNTRIEKDISSQSRSFYFSGDLKSGTNRKLTYTVTLGIQTEQSFLKTKTRWLNKSLESENSLLKEKQKEKVEDKQLKEKVNERVECKLWKERHTDINLKGKQNESVEDTKLKGTSSKKMRISSLKDKQSERDEDRNLFHSIEDLISVPREKQQMMSQENFFESLLPSSKVTLDDILEIDNSDRISQKVPKKSEKMSCTEVEIRLPNKSKVAQLYTDIDWLALSDSDDGQPMNYVVQKECNKETENKSSSLSGESLLHVMEENLTGCSEHELASLNKTIPNFSEQYKHVCDIRISSTADKSLDFVNIKPQNEKGKLQEVYVYPSKPVISEVNELVSVSNAKPSKLDEQLNLKTSNNLLDLIAKTMGIIPESAKQKFEKSVLSLLTNATSPSDLNNSEILEKPKDTVIIMNNSTRDNEFTSDITVIDEGPKVKNEIPDRTSNDHVIRPSNFCNLSSPYPKSSDPVVKNKSPSPKFFMFLDSKTEPTDLTKKCTSDNKIGDLKTTSTTVSQNCSVTFQNQYTVSNLDAKSDCLASRRRSPRPPNIITNDQTQMDVLNNCSKDDTASLLSDQESPTIITNFDFEKYAEYLKEETFYTTEPLSPIRPVSLIPACDKKCVDNPDNRQCEKSNFVGPGQGKNVVGQGQVKNVVTSTDAVKCSNENIVPSTSQTLGVNTSDKSDVFLKPLAIDCSQTKEDESYICDISPPLEGPTQNISPVDLAKVATSKMTNELILKSQGFAQGLLQMSFDRSLHPHPANIAFLPSTNPQLYVSSRQFSSVSQHKSPPENLCRNLKLDNSSTSSALSPFEENLNSVHFIDVHLNSYNTVGALSSPKSNITDRRQRVATAPDAERWDKRQNVIISPPFNLARPKHIIEEGNINSPPYTQVQPKQIIQNSNSGSSLFNQQRPTQVEDTSIHYKHGQQKSYSERQDIGKQKRHNVNILRHKKTNERRQSLPTKINTNYNQHNSSFMSSRLNELEKTQNLHTSAKTNIFLDCDTDQQDAILDMLEKTNRGQNNKKSCGSPDTSDKFQHQRMHPKFAAHHSYSQISNAEKLSSNSPKMAANTEQFSRLQDQETFMLNSRLASHEHSGMKLRTKFENASKTPCQEVSKSSRLSDEKIQGKTTDKAVDFHQVPRHQEAMLLNSGTSLEQLHQRPNLTNIHRSHSFDQANVKNDFGFHIVQENSVICSPVLSRTCNYTSASTGNVFNYQKTIQSVSQNQPNGPLSLVGSRPELNSHITIQSVSQNQPNGPLSLVGLRPELTSHINNQRFLSQVQRQLSAPCSTGTQAKTSASIVQSSDYENVSSPEEVEVYPTTPRSKDIPQKQLTPYRLEQETLSLHSADKGQSSQVSIPQNYNFKSSLDHRVQYRQQRELIEPVASNRLFPEQRPTAFYNNLPSSNMSKARDVYEPSVQFSEYCQNADISDSILDNI